MRLSDAITADADNRTPLDVVQSIAPCVHKAYRLEETQQAPSGLIPTHFKAQWKPFDFPLPEYALLPASK